MRTTLILFVVVTISSFTFAGNRTPQPFDEVAGDRLGGAKGMEVAENVSATEQPPLVPSIFPGWGLGVVSCKAGSPSNFPIYCKLRRPGRLRARMVVSSGALAAFLSP